MIRKIIRINEDLCNGCGACANACHEGAIAMVNGKAKLIRDDYCDGLGNCLPACPTGAISFEEREAAAYDEAAVARHMEARKQEQQAQHAGGCPGIRIRQFNMDGGSRAETAAPGIVPSQLRQWPVQIKLAPINAPYFDGANLLVAADCTAYAYGNFHQDFIRGRVTLIGCPKLDMVDYTEKLTEILRRNDVRSLTVVRMEVPCCGGIEAAAKKRPQSQRQIHPVARGHAFHRRKNTKRLLNAPDSQISWESVFFIPFLPVWTVFRRSVII